MMSQCDNTNPSYVAISASMLICSYPPNSHKSGHFNVLHFLSVDVCMHLCLCAMPSVCVPFHVIHSKARQQLAERSVLIFYHKTSRDQSEDCYAWQQVSPPTKPSCQPKGRHLESFVFLTEWWSACMASLDFQDRAVGQGSHNLSSLWSKGCSPASLPRSSTANRMHCARCPYCSP